MKIPLTLRILVGADGFVAEDVGGIRFERQRRQAAHHTVGVKHLRTLINTPLAVVVVLAWEKNSRIFFFIHAALAVAVVLAWLFFFRSRCRTCLVEMKKL
jgi:hypothetical protein